jgi:DNA-binding transcriptional MerR regulator
MYTTTEAAKIIGVGSRRVSNWNLHGIFTATIKHPGSGTQRTYDREDCYILCIIKQMQDSGAEGVLMRRIAEYLDINRDLLKYKYLILQDNGLIQKLDEISYSENNVPTDCWLIPMEKIRNDVDLKCEQISS